MSAEPAEFGLESKYRVLDGDVLLTGVQALVRVLFDQVRADRRNGLRTGAFVSGYPGSPLGGFDLTLQRTGPLLGELDVHLVPGVNEDLAATAVWGSQQDNLAPLRDLAGVIGMWYGKAPGVDRCGDVFRQANLHGAGRHGGVLVAAGDDPQSKSSTVPSASEIALYDAGMPVLAPGNVQQVLDLGRHGYELSRLSGCWVGFKIVTAVADGFARVTVHPDRISPVRPEVIIDGQRWRHVQRPRFFLPDTIELEAELHDRRLQAARLYARANRLDVVEVDPDRAWLTIAAYGRTFAETRQALRDLGLSDADLRRAGVRLLRISMIFPLDQQIVRHAARGVEEFLILEEKRSFVELFVRDALYSLSERPRVAGKRDEEERPLVPVDGELTADRLRPILAARLRQRRPELPGLPARPERPALRGLPTASLARPRTELKLLPAPPVRSAAFCSGCPHNSSTVEASGSPVGGGVGCHAMVMWMDRGAVSYTHMGGEGAQWIGRAAFTDVPHFVQNVGDGTFFHSAILALRAAVAADVTMTFKLLYNGVVAMTGGQEAAGGQDVPTVAAELALEGATRIIVVSDDPRRYPRGTRWPANARVWPRDALAEAERALAAERGVTVLIYDQACANELRRLRKRGQAPVRPRKVVINEAVCEGCGDCGTKSNCLSVHPVPTELGRKTQIHQSSCNTDYTCLSGDCPSFVTAQSRPGTSRPDRARAGSAAAGIVAGQPPAEVVIGEPPDKAMIGEAGYEIVVAGIGGTGIVTLNQVLATASFLDGLQLTGVDQTGLSQKGGPVVSHLRLAGTRHAGSSGVGEGSADLLLATDLVVATDPRYIAKASPQRTVAVASASMVPTIAMVQGHADLADPAPLLALLQNRTRPGGLVSVDSTGLAETLLGDGSPANILLTGVAYQRGAIPLSAESIERAITINAVAVDRNIAAFRAGRRWVADARATGSAGRTGAAAQAALPDQAGPPDQAWTPDRAGAIRRHWADADEQAAARLGSARGLSGAAVRRAAALVAYQSPALAGRYLDLVARTRDAERSALPESAELTAAVTEGFFHLLAYKDEYEVARLHLLPEFDAALRLAVPGATRIRYQLHPPLLRALGMSRKIALPPALARPAFRVLRAMRRLRGTPLDLFGRTEVRRTERELAAGYEQDIAGLLAALSPGLLPVAAELARLPLSIRGYESIKLAAVRRYQDDRRRLLQALASEPVGAGPGGAG